jgi:hypothetical protein
MSQVIPKASEQQLFRICWPISTQHSARRVGSRIVIHTLKSLRSSEVFHNRSPQTAAILIHHGLERHTINISNNTTKSFALRSGEREGQSIFGKVIPFSNYPLFTSYLIYVFSSMNEDTSRNPTVQERHVLSYSFKSIFHEVW